MWVHTRSVWNQHAYAIDNIDDDYTVPDVVNDWWRGHNTFRANKQGRIPLNAADVEVELEAADDGSCPPELKISFTVHNPGLNTIPEGLPVTLYDADDGSALKTVVVDEPIPPGGIVKLEMVYEVPQNKFNQDINLRVAANDDGEQEFVYDCNPDSATISLDTMRCNIQH